MTSPTFFTVSADYRPVSADASTDSDYDPQTDEALSATVTFTPVLATGDVILATDASPRPTGYVCAPIVAMIDAADGRLKLRTTPDAGGSGTFAPVRLLADTALLELDTPLYYRVTFTAVTYGGKIGSITSFTFQAPTSDTELNLISVSPAPGELPSGITKIAPGGVRLEDGDIIFSFAGVDIPDPFAFDPSFTSTGITDSTATGRSLITAASAAAARTTLGATTTGSSLITAANAAAARTAMDLYSSSGGYLAPAIDILGDSITRQNGGTVPTSPPSGTAYGSNSSYQSRGFLTHALIILGQRLRCGTNFGIGGQTASSIYARLADVLASPNPYVHVFAGVNDVGQGIPVATTKTNLKAIYSDLIAAGKIVTTSTVTPTLSTAGSAVLANISAGVSSFSSPTNFSNGDVLVLGSAGNTETVTVSSFTGSGPYTVTLTAPITLSHVAGEPFSNSTKLAMIHDINQWIIDFCQGRYRDPGTNTVVVNSGKAPFLVDWYSLVADPSTGKPVGCLNANGTVKSVTDDPLVMLVDGTHPGQDLAHRMGHALALVLDRIVPPLPVVVTDDSENANLMPNPRCVGNTGGLATGFTMGATSGSITATASKVARTDGVPGEMQQVAIGPGNTGGLQIYSDTGATLTFTGNDYYVGQIEFETDANLVSTGLLGNCLKLFVDLRTGSSIVTNQSSPFNTTGGQDGCGSIWDKSGVFKTSPILVPAAVNRVMLFLQANNVDTGTFRIKSMRFGKVEA